MNSFSCFAQKEGLELIRTGKLLILLLISAVFGIMNPLVAKLTPWLIQSMSDQLSQAGMQVQEVSVDALTSWTQFYKNIPLLLLVFAVMLSGLMASEYQNGILTLLLTKGLKRSVVILVKFLSSVLLWTLGFWSCYGITYLYSSLLWTNDAVSHLFFSAFCVYAFGLWLLSLLLLLSALFSSGYGALASCGAVLALFYFLSFLSKAGNYLPLKLMSSSKLLTDSALPEDFFQSLLFAGVLLLLQLFAAIFCFRKKAL